MNENLDLRKILKDCPKDWKFYSTIFGEETYVSSIDGYEGNPCPIKIYGSFGKSVTYCISRNGHPFADSCGECCLFPSREIRDWSKFTAPWYKKEKFDPHTLKPFDKVLVRDSSQNFWRCSYFSHIDDTGEYKYCAAIYHRFCIPYNEDTKHLVGTKYDAPEYYRYWDE